MRELVPITDLEAFCHVARASSSQQQSQMLLDSIKSLAIQGYSVKSWTKAACACVSNPDPLVLETGAVIIKDIIDWKDTYDGAKHIVLQLRMKPDLSMLDDANWKIQFVMYDLYAKVGQSLQKATEEFPASKMAGADVAELMHLCFTDYHTYYAALLKQLHKMADWTNVPVDEKEDHMQAILAFYLNSPERNIQWYLQPQQVFLNNMQMSCHLSFLRSIRVKKDHENILKKIRTLFETLNSWKVEDLFSDDGKVGPGYILHQIMYYFLVRNSRDPVAMKKLTEYVPDCVQWTFRSQGHEGIEAVRQSSLKFLEGVLMTVPSLLTQQLDNIMKLYISKPVLSLIRSIKTAYGREQATESIIHKHISQLFVVFDKVDENQKASISDLIKMISEKHPQMLEHSIDQVERLLANRLSARSGIDTLNNIAQYCSQAFSGRGGEYCTTLKSVECKKLCAQLIPACFNNISLLNENESVRMTSVLMRDSEEMHKDAAFVRNLLALWTTLVQKYPAALVQAKDTLLRIKSVQEQHTRSIDYIIATSEKAPKTRSSPSRTSSRNGEMSMPREASVLPNVPIGKSLDDMAPAVLLCFHPTNLQQALALKEDLENIGYLSWMDKGTGSDKSQIGQETLRALQDATVAVTLVSSSSLLHDRITKEVQMAHRLKKPIVPLMFDDMSLTTHKGPQALILSNFNTIPFYPVKIAADAYNNRTWSRKSFDLLCKKLYHCGVDPLASKDVKMLRGQLNKSLPSSQQSKTKPPPSAFNSSQIGISCSPDKVFEMQCLNKYLQSFGYSCKVVSYTDSSIVRIKSQVVICALSLRYSKSSMAASEMREVVSSGRRLIPLWLDDITYPPNNGMKQSLKGIQPIDCRKMVSKAEWSTSEGEALLAKLKSAFFSANNNLISTDKKSFILDPLAREASEIRIQVRPPTPDSLKMAQKPLRPRSLSMSDVPPVKEEDEESDDGNESSDQSAASSDSESQVAKKMQSSKKLPELPGRPRSRPKSGETERSASPSQRRRSSAASNTSNNGGGRPNRARSTSEETFSVAKTNKPQRQTYGKPVRSSERNDTNHTTPSIRDRGSPKKAQSSYNPDAPKLPSVYRQRHH